MVCWSSEDQVLEAVRAMRWSQVEMRLVQTLIPDLLMISVVNLLHISSQCAINSLIAFSSSTERGAQDVSCWSIEEGAQVPNLSWTINPTFSCWSIEGGGAQVPNLSRTINWTLRFAIKSLIGIRSSIEEGIKVLNKFRMINLRFLMKNLSLLCSDKLWLRLRKKSNFSYVGLSSESGT